MNTVFGNLWDFEGIKCITTNGTLVGKDKDRAVMGRGVAYQATQRFSNIAYVIGGNIKLQGNHVQLIPHWKLITFPVKHNWWEKADLELIAESTRELMNLNNSLLTDHRWAYNIYLPRPGCGNGGLTWAEVEPIVSVLPDNVYVVGWPNEIS